MKKNGSLIKMLLFALVLGVAIFLINRILQDNKPASILEVKLPTLSAEAKIGESVFNENCIACHGKNAAGSDKGPPLVHKFYQSRMHADGAFVLAAARGVRSHHWGFGSMPAQPQVSVKQVGAIVTYVRELQKANGIK